ncbi:MAG: alanine racemase, partial [Luteibaculum sp.]
MFGYKAKNMVRHSSRILLSQSALKNNINFLRKKLKPDTIFSAVVKANAYGHGIPQMTQMLEKCGVKHFSVASAFEAEEVLNHCSPTSSIMIMGILYDEDISWAIEHGIEFFVFDLKRLPMIAEKAKTLGKKALIHIELETGTNRTGMTVEHLPDAISFLKKNKAHLDLAGVCTHLGGAESLANEFKIKPQIDRFLQATKIFDQKGMPPKKKHMACSAAALAYPETHLDMVRFGVVTYGFWPSPDVFFLHRQENGNGKNNPLKRIITWKTEVMDIKEVKEGQFIGYGTAFQAQRNMHIAVLPLGYSNGYPRALSNRGFVLLGGKKAPIVGLINMNLFMVDISHIKGVEIGDEVVLLGKQKNNVINVSSFTNFTQLLNNEMLSRLPAAIPREIVR